MIVFLHFSPLGRGSIRIQFPATVVQWEASSVLLLDVERHRRRHQAVAATAAGHHGGSVAVAPQEAGADPSPSAAVGAVGGRGRGGGRGRLLELLLVDFTFLGSAVLEPDLHLEDKKKFK